MLGGELPRDSLSEAFLLKGFRISNTALYPAGQFTPPNKLEPEGQATALCLDFNSGSPTQVVDLSSERRRAKLPLPWWMNSTDFIALSSPKTQTNPNTTTPPSVSSTSKFKNPAPPSERNSPTG